MNAFRQVPTLMVGDTPLTQSLAILEYLEETYPTPPLLPSDVRPAPAPCAAQRARPWLRSPAPPRH